MAHDSPIDDNIPRDPTRKDTDASMDPDITSDQGDLHDSHWHNTSPKRVNEAPRCGFCGYDRSGLQPDDICSECGKHQSAPLCTFCGYELSGLQVTQSCPECGKPIWDSNINPPTSGLAIASMVIGITSIPSCIFYGIPALILGPLAIIFGEISIRQFKKGERAGYTKGFALTGRICGWISFTTAVVGLGLLIWAIIVS